MLNQRAIGNAQGSILGEIVHNALRNFRGRTPPQTVVQ